MAIDSVSNENEKVELRMSNVTEVKYRIKNDFEAAAKYRDQLIGLRTIQERHGSQFSSDMDVVSIVNDADTHCIELVFVRGGKQVGSETFNSQVDNMIYQRWYCKL